jgi:DNA-binding transcriptional LysR family regulator
METAASGLGVVHLASWLVYERVASGQLISLFPVATPRADKKGSAIHAVRLKGRSHAAKAQLFISHLNKVFGSPPYWDRAIDKKRRAAAIDANLG